MHYLIGYGSYMSREELETVIDGAFQTYQARIIDYIRIFNLPHQSYRYPIMGDLKGVMNVQSRMNHSINVTLVEFENDNSWNAVELREGKMYNKVEVEAIIISGERTGETIMANMFIGRDDRTQKHVYPLPSYYKLVQKAAEDYGESFYEEYMKTTFMQLNEMLITLDEYEKNAYTFNQVHRLADRINNKDKKRSMDFQGAFFDDMGQAETQNFERDYYLEAIANFIMMTDNTPTSYHYMLGNQKIEFYRGTLIRSSNDNTFWARYEAMRQLPYFNVFWDQRKNVPYAYKQPIRVIMDRSVLPNTSVVVQLIGQILLGLINPMTLAPWISGPEPVTLMWKHYMEGLFKNCMTLDRWQTDNTLDQPTELLEWIPGHQTAQYDNMLGTFDELTIINNEVITRREHVQFPIELPLNYERDYRETTNKSGNFWTQWVWIYTKYDRITTNIYSFVKFEENVSRNDIIQISSAKVNNSIKYKQRSFGEENIIKYLRTPYRNYVSDDDVLMISDEYE